MSIKLLDILMLGSLFQGLIIGLGILLPKALKGTLAKYLVIRSCSSQFPEMKHLPYLIRISLSSIILAQLSNTEIRSKWGKYQVAKKAILVSLLFLSISSKAQQPELVIPIGHTGYISSLEFSPDGQYLLTTAEAGIEVAKIWDLSGREVATLKNEIGCARMGKFSPDGKYIITACDTGFFQVWDRKTKTLIATRAIGDNLIFAVGFSPDGTLAEVTYEGGTEQYKILNSELERVGEKLSYFDGESIYPTNITYSKDGQLILTHSRKAPSATLRKADGTKLLTLPDSIFASGISPDNKYIITSGAGKLIKHWTIDGQLLRSFELENKFNGIEFSPNGKYLVAKDKFYTYLSYPDKIYSLQGEPIQAINKYGTFAISPDDKMVAAISSAGELLILDINGKIIRNISKKISAPIESISFTPDGKKLLSRSGDLPTNKVWDLNTMTVQPIKMFLPTVFSPDNSRSLTLGKDNTAVIRDAKGWPIQVLKGHNAPVTSLAFSPSNANDPVGGKFILTASADSTAKLWNLQGQEIHSFQWEPQLYRAKNGATKAAIFSATFSNDGESIFMRNHTNNLLQEWELSTVDQGIFSPSTTLVYPTIKELPILSLYQNLGISIVNGAIVDTATTNLTPIPVPQETGFPTAFAPDGPEIMTATSGYNVALLDPTDQTELDRFASKISWSNKIAFSADGAKIVSATHPKYHVRLWSRPGQLLQSLQGHKGMIHSITFSPDGQHILTASADGTARMWDMQGKIVARFKGHSGEVTTAAFFPDGTKVLTGGEDRMAIIWNLKGEVIKRIPVWKEGGIDAIAIAPNGKEFIAALDRYEHNLKIIDLNGTVLDSFTSDNNYISKLYFSDWDSAQHVITIGKNDYDDDDLNIIELYNRKGALVRTLKKYDTTFNPLAFSPDGEHFLSRKIIGGIAIRDSIGQVLHHFAAHDQPVTNIEVNSDGNFFLTTSSNDPLAKLWDLTGKELNSFNHPTFCKTAAFVPPSFNIRRALAQGKPLILTGGTDKRLRLWDWSGQALQSFKGHTNIINTIAFSPDGKYLATGSQDQTVKIWNKNFEVIKTFFVEKTVLKVRFSPDSQFITATYDEGYGTPSESTISWNTKEDEINRTYQNYDILSYVNDQGLKLATGRDSLYLMGSTAEQLNLSSPLTEEEVQLLDSTDQLIWAFSNLPKVASVHSGDRLIVSDPGGTMSLWDLQNKNIKTIESQPGNPATAVAVSPDGQHIITSNITDSNPALPWSDEFLLLSTDTLKGSIWELSAKTRLLLEGHTSTIKDVTFSPEGKWLATAGADHVIKIWDRKTGEELVTLFAIDSTDWVVTSPSGLFDASPSAMYRLYYVVSEEIIELEQLKSRYYEPGLLQKLLGLSDERIRPVEAFDTLRLYPTVQAEIIQDSLHIKLRARNGGIGKASLFINGKEVMEEVNPLPRGKNTKRDSIIHYHLQQHQNYLFRHPDSTNIISIRAYNEEGWLKSPAITLAYKLPAARSRGSSSTAEENAWVGQLHPKLYVVSIGTSDYTGTQLDLEYADQDATMMAKALQSVGAALFTNGDSLEVYCLSTANVDSTGFQGSTVQWEFAQKDNIKATFDKIKRKAKAEDVIVVYLSGHGVTQGGTDQTQFYYLTQGVASEDDLADPATLKAYTISTEELTKWINDIPALKQVLIIDACNSGQIVENVTGGTKALNSSQVRALDRMKDRTGMFLLSGSASNKVSYEAGQYGQGLLTYALLQGMRGVAVRKDTEGKEVVDVMTLFQYARDEVPRLAASINGIQTPMLGFPGRSASFDIGLLDKEAKATIPIGNKKPVMIRSNFLNEITYSDDLQLVQRLEKAFRKESAKGARANLIYVDVNEYPNAYALRGFYKIKGENIEVRLKLFRGKESFDLDIPLVNSAEELVGEIRWLVQEKIAELEEE